MDDRALGLSWGLRVEVLLQSRRFNAPAKCVPDTLKQFAMAMRVI